MNGVLYTPTPCARCSEGDAAPGHVICQRCIDSMDVRSSVPVFRFSGRLLLWASAAVLVISLPWWLGLVALSRLLGVIP